jgi:hypothetical protein
VLGAGEDDLVPVGDETISLGLGEIGLREFRRHPAGRRVGDFLLPHLILVGKSLDVHYARGL